MSRLSPPDVDKQQWQGSQCCASSSPLCCCQGWHSAQQWGAAAATVAVVFGGGPSCLERGAAPIVRLVSPPARSSPPDPGVQRERVQDNLQERKTDLTISGGRVVTAMCLTNDLYPFLPGSGVRRWGGWIYNCKNKSITAISLAQLLFH